jgi:hypothetical protein
MPEDKLVNLGGTIEGFPRTPIVPDIPSPTIGAQPGTNKSFDDLFNQGLSTVKFKGKENIPLSTIYTGNRFPESRPGTDPEEMAARQQEWTDKWGNSIAKFAGTAATTFVSGTAGLLWGIGSAAANWNFSSLIKNDVTEAMDQTMKEFDDYAPNYYTQNERDAEFLSSDNLLTANFWGDKVFKNLGYSIGSLGGGLAWSKVFKMIGATNALVKAGKGLETATALETAMTNVPKVQKFAALESTLNTLGQKYIKSPLGSVLSDADRVLTSTMGTFGEASMEGLQNMNSFRDNAIEEYRNKYGFTPTGSDLAEIDAYSQKIGSYTWGMNTLLLSATNYIQLPKILNSSRKGERAMINDIGQAEVGGAFSKMVPANKALDIYSKAKGLGRFLFSGTEAFEEGAQYAIQIGTDDYFKRAYTNKQDLKSFLSTMNGVMSNVVNEGVEETLGSKEGLESILIGGLSGGMQQARGNYKQGGLFGEGGSVGKNTDLAIQAVNKTNIKQTLAEQAKYIAIGLGSQKLRQAAILNNDKLNEKDYESDFTLSYIMPRAKYGKADSIYNELSYYESQALSQGGFEELQTKGIANQIETKEEFLERIQGIKATTKLVDDLYTSIQDKYSNETTEDGKQKYSNQNIDSLVYAASKINHYDSRIPQVNNALNIAGISTIDVLEGIITDSKPNKEATETAIAQINAMDVIDDIKTDLKRDLSDVIELSMRRKQFIKDYNRISNDPSKVKTLEDFDLYTEDEMFAEVEQEIVPEGKVRKKIVKKELEVGREYSLKQPFIRKGNQLQLGPKIGIVSKVLGGEFEVVLPNGQTTFLTPEEFKQFDISDDSNDSEALAASMEKAIDSVLSSKKYESISKPEFVNREDKLEFINSLDNTELVNDIENLFNKNYSEIIKLEEQKEKEEDFLNEEGISDEIIDDLDNSQPTLTIEDAVYEYQFRKEIFIVPSATTASTGKPHHVRANAFGTRLDKLPNRNNIRGLYITQANEEALGLKGFTKHLVKETSAVSETVIALVMIEVDPKTGKRFFVDEFGKRISKPTVDNTIYQVFPLEDLSWDSKWSKDGKRESMFRVGTPKEHEEAVRAQYAKWRANTLKKAPTEPVEIEASFGFPEYVQTELDEEGNSMDDFSARVSVVDSGLITDAALANSPVIFIPTVEESISKGSTTFTNVKGIPFLSLRDAYVPLSNRILTSKEVDIVFDAIIALGNNFQKSRFAEEKEKAKLKAKRKELIDWLKTVVYWGTPETSKGVAKDASTNSIWFEKIDDNLVLFVSNNEDNFSLSPISLAQNETKIKELLSGMYNNINATRVKGSNSIAWDAPYTEITSITPDGVITSKQWKNYQTYLLSGTGRTAESLPLATNIRPLKTSEDVNREGVYFIVPKLQGVYDLPETVETEKETEEPGAIAKTIVPGKPIVPVAPAPEKPSSAKQFDLRKGVVNTLITNDGIIVFEAEEDKVINAKLGQELNGIKIDFDNPDTNKYLLDYVDVLSRVKTLQGKSVKELSTMAKQELQSIVYDTIMNPPAVVVTPAAPVVVPKKGPIKSNARRAATRLKIQRDIANTKFEDWGEVESFIKANYPNIPVYRVKNMIRATNGREAWGMYEDGAIYITENAEVGTAYHEVFHAIWRMSTSPAERRDIAKEFRSRDGQFFDRDSTTYIQYANATDEQLEEALAEEFRDYVQFKKVPVKPKDGRNFIQRAFADLLNLIKTFFSGKKAKLNANELFNRIGNGYYKTYNQDKYALSFAKEGVIDIDDAYATDEAAFLLKNLSGENVNDIIQEMNYRTISRLVSNDKSLFTVNAPLNRTELYTSLKEDVLQNVDNLIDAAEELYNEEGISEDEQLSLEAELEKYLKLKENIVNEWDNITKIHEDSLRSYSIEFDENDNTTLNSDERTRESGWADANKIDSFRKASVAIKLVLSTVPYTETLEDGSVVTQESSVGGAILIPTSQVYMAVMNTVHDNLTVEEMMENLRKMALKDSNYASLYKRLTKSNDLSVPASLVDNLNNRYNSQLLTSFWSTFKKQNPDVQTVFVLENGSIVVGDSNFTTAARQLREKFRNSIIGTMKDPKNKFFYYNTNKKAYFGKKGSATSVKPNTNSRISFLKDLGIDFKRADIVELSGNDPQIFATAVDAIKKDINEAKAVATSGFKMLDISGRLLELGIIKAKIDNPEFSSTYFNVNGERTQTFIGTNALSDLYDFLSHLDAFTPENLAGTPYEYLLTDKFAKESTILNRMFDMESPEKRKRDVTNVEGLMKPAYADGIVDSQNGTKKQSSKLQIRDRIIQELNLNLAGYYMNLVPGSASLEWMVKMGNPITAQNISNDFDAIYKVFKGYFMSEMAVSREKDRPIVVIGDRKKTDLRFLKPILGKDLHDRLVNKKGKIEDIYNENVEEINNAITNFIEKDTKSFKKNLEGYEIITASKTSSGKPIEGLYDFNSISLIDSTRLTEEKLMLQLTALNASFIINNIELHKLVYSDPYQYKDELKRTKLFNSSSQPLVSSPEMNTLFDKVWNGKYNFGDLGYTDFIFPYFRTVTLDDVLSASDMKNYVNGWKETDGGGIITMKANRNFRIRAGNWISDSEELQYEYEVEFEKLVKSGASVQKINEFMLKNPKVKSAYTPIKPKAIGGKLNDKKYKDIVADKFALYPLSYSVLYELAPKNEDGSVIETNAMKHYDKMQKEFIDYSIFESGRKVGSEEKHSLYNPTDGSFNNDPYEGIINIPFNILSVQSEVPSKDTPNITRGSQVTKLVTLDLMDVGVPVDFMEGSSFDERYEAWTNPEFTEEQKKIDSPLYKEIKNNQFLLEELMREGYLELLDRLSIKEENNTYVITDFSVAAKTLRDEIFKNEVNYNISAALDAFLNGKAVIESTPAYQQIRNILYSIADKNIVSPSISGGFKVQISPALFETTKIKPEKYVNKEGQTKYRYTSDLLDFYSMTEKDGKKTVNVCEIMIGRWFESDMSDKDLLDYLNNTAEGQKILSGFAFRIPTQKQNSIEVFKIKQFLPKEFGDSVVVPSALVNKTGSDFDIDKLSIYLKNVFTDIDNKLKLIEYKGSKDATIKFYENIFNKKLEINKANKEKALVFATKNIDRISSILKIQDANTRYKVLVENEYLTELVTAFKYDFEDVIGFLENKVGSLKEKLGELNSEEVQAEFRKYYATKKYKQALENSYIESSQNLASTPYNYERLTKPNSAEDLKKLTKDVLKKLGRDTFDYTNTKNLINRTFMVKLRQAYVSGKYGIGIVAQSQTNLSLSQRTNIYVNSEKSKLQSEQDKEYLKDGNLRFAKYNKVKVDGKDRLSLSKIQNVSNEDISDLISQVMDGYLDVDNDPWVMELGITPNVAPTWLFLIRAGVPINQIAFFMNQPIIKDYLRSIENSGYTWLFIDDIRDEIKNSDKYTVSKTEVNKITVIPGTDYLYESIGRTGFSLDSRARQQFMLDEFLKYAKMANQLFLVTQATTFDTSTFNDPFLVFKKLKQLEKARTTIISSVDDVLDNSFLRELSETIKKFKKAYSAILISENPLVNDTLEKVLAPYIDLPDRDFVKLAQKAVADLFDWSVQNSRNLNQRIPSLLISNETNTAKEFAEFVNKVKSDFNHPLYNNQIINLYDPQYSDSERGVNNMSLINKDNKVYDQNRIIYGFTELKEHLKNIGNIELYNKIVETSILQSGLSTSKISFTNLLPYADVAEIYNKTLSNLGSNDTFILSDFYDLGIFERNNWANDDIVPRRKAKWKKASTYTPAVYNANMVFGTAEVNEAMLAGDLPALLKLSTAARESNRDYVTYSWEDQSLSQEERDRMKKSNDYSYIKKGLFKKVYNGTEALTIKNFIKVKDAQGNYVNKPIENFIYKQINAWGDSFRANEFYSISRTSVIENGFLEVENEVSDMEVAKYFIAKLRAKTEATANFSTEGDLLPEMGVPKELQDIIIDSNLSPEDYNLVLINGTPTLINKQYVPNIIKKGYSTFYSSAGAPNSLYERVGKQIVIPGYEDVDLAIEQDTNIIYELSTGGFIELKATTQKEIIKELESKFIEKDVRAVIDGAKKIQANSSDTIMVPMSKVSAAPILKDVEDTISLKGKVYKKSDVNTPMLENLGFTPAQIGKILKQIC